MANLWAVLGALATVVLPMALAGWLLGRPPRQKKARREARGKMPSDEEL